MHTILGIPGNDRSTSFISVHHTHQDTKNTQSVQFHSQRCVTNTAQPLQKLNFIFSKQHIRNALFNHILSPTVATDKLSGHHFQFQQRMVNILQNLIIKIRGKSFGYRVANLRFPCFGNTYIGCPRSESCPINLLNELEDKLAIKIVFSFLESSFI